MESQMVAGVYFFFLLAGITFGMVVGWVMGYQAAAVEFLSDADDLDDDDDSVLEAREVR